jgi:hypothetical protein
MSAIAEGPPLVQKEYDEVNSLLLSIQRCIKSPIGFLFRTSRKRYLQPKAKTVKGWDDLSSLLLKIKGIVRGGELFEVFQVDFYFLSLVSFIRSVFCGEELKSAS